jgi:hypothetical protein
MNRNLIVVVLATAVVLTSASCASAARQQKIASMQYLVGKWHCSHVVGTFSGDYTTTYANVPGDMWLRQKYDFPATPMQAAWQAEAIMGYDEKRDAWVRFLVLSTGPYFVMRMTETADGGWSWKYVSLFPTQRAETPGSDATLTKKSDVEYTVEGPSYKENGTGPLVTEHHVCRKL